MKDFIENYSLFEEYLLLEDYRLNHEGFTDKSDFLYHKFDFYCEREELIRPFELDFSNRIKSTITGVNYGQVDNKRISTENLIDDKLNYTFAIFGKCNSCCNYKVHFLLNVYSDNKISKILSNSNNISLSEVDNSERKKVNIYVKKVGCSVQPKITIDKNISKHFGRETNNWLYKAKKLLTIGAGIGSFAYFRRIIEKELINIIEEIKLLPESETNEIQTLLDKYSENPRTFTIYENIFNHLPNSLKMLGDNPIQLLYKQTSEGLHSLSEDECLKKALNIETILEFTLRKINEENSDIKSVKDAIKNLK